MTAMTVPLTAIGSTISLVRRAAFLVCLVPDELRLEELLGAALLSRRVLCKLVVMDEVTDRSVDIL